MKPFIVSLALVGALVPSSAVADDIRGPVVTADGFVLIALEREGDGSELRRRLASPTEELSIHEGLQEFRYDEDGSCQMLYSRFVRRGDTHTVQTRRCPTDGGWTETLVESSLYSHYEVFWTFAQNGENTQLQWELKAEIPGVAPIVLNFHLGEEMRRGLRSLGAGN